MSPRKLSTLRTHAIRQNPQSGSALAERLVGDIAIAHGVEGRRPRHAGLSESSELRVLALHGLLHLLGYDHERDGGQMRRLEGRLRRRGGLREGLVGWGRGASCFRLA